MKESNTARKTAAIFVDDGGDDAYEFATNYVWFDPTDSLARRRAWNVAEALWAVRVSRLPASALHTIAAPRLYVDDAEQQTDEEMRQSA